MHGLICPHCGQRAISVLRKMVLPRGLPATCRACGRKVGVVYESSRWSIIGLVVGAGIGHLAAPFALQVALLAGAMLVMSIPFVRLQPLEKR